MRRSLAKAAKRIRFTGLLILADLLLGEYLVSAVVAGPANPVASAPASAGHGSVVGRQPLGGGDSAANAAESLPALIDAVYGRHVDLVKQLLAQGADPNTVDSAGMPVLHYAAMQDKAAVLRLLLAAGAAPDRRDREGRTALHIASLNGSVAALGILLQAGVPPDTVDCRWNSALHLAAIHDKAEAAKMLLRARADFHRKNSLCRTPYDESIIRDSPACATLLKSAGATASGLITAAALGNMTLVRWFAPSGRCIDQRDGDGITALIAASERGQLEVVRYLLDRGASASALADSGTTPLLAAIGNGHIEVARLLLEHGAPVNQVSDGMTALGWGAVVNGDKAAVSLLLSYGADPEAGKGEDMSAVAFAEALWPGSEIEAMIHAAVAGKKSR